MISLTAALAGSLILNLCLLAWRERDARDNSRRRSQAEAYWRRIGELKETTATVGDLSEGTLSPAHAEEIAMWIHGLYHAPWCSLLEGWPQCCCGGVPDGAVKDPS